MTGTPVVPSTALGISLLSLQICSTELRGGGLKIRENQRERKGKRKEKHPDMIIDRVASQSREIMYLVLSVCASDLSQGDNIQTIVCMRSIGFSFFRNLYFFRNRK